MKSNGYKYIAILFFLHISSAHSQVFSLNDLIDVINNDSSYYYNFLKEKGYHQVAKPIQKVSDYIDTKEIWGLGSRKLEENYIVIERSFTKRNKLRYIELDLGFKNPTQFQILENSLKAQKFISGGRGSYFKWDYIVDLNDHRFAIGRGLAKD